MPVRIPEYRPGDDIPGTVYKVHKVLGQGGMGTVYEVEDTSVGKKYVLKTLHGDLADRKDLAARLSREARALAKLQHPNIVEVYTSGTTGDALALPYYVMERMHGNSLRYVLQQKGRLSVEQACDIATDLLDALDHAHGYGIIHRDVKPDNIFITRARDGRSLAKLLDFGIIKLATTTAGNTTMHTGGRFVGTFRYAPPEQICNHDVTPRSDLYAASLVIYEMVAGRGPFDDFAGEMEIGKAHIAVPPPPLSRFIDVPQPFEQLVMSALEKDPERRPRDAFTFAGALRALKARFRADAQGATVEQVIVPPSAARPAIPFSTEETDVRANDIVPPSDGVTRIDGPAAMRTHTISMGVRPLDAFPPPATYAAAPITAAVAQAPVVVDRRAETRDAVPMPTPQPNNDTAPIPLAVLAPRPEAPVSTPPNQSETFGPHTTEASERKKAARKSILAAGVVGGVALLAIAMVVGLRQRTPATSTPPLVEVPTVVAPETSAVVVAAPIPPASSTAVIDTTPPEPLAKHVAPPVTHAPPPGRTTAAQPVPTPTASTAPTATATHRRVGSGL
jgi:serine/threonine protein kinase